MTHMFELEDEVFKHIKTSNNLEEKMDTMDEKMKDFSRDVDVLEPKNTFSISCDGRCLHVQT